MTLAEGRGGIRISLFLPTRRGGAEASGNRLRLKNLLRYAAHALAADGVAARQADALLRPVRQFADPPEWSNPSDGLALFVGPDHLLAHRVPRSPTAPGGRVETLFLLVDAPGWKHDAEVAPVYDVVDGADDLLDRAAVHTQCRGGHVYTIPAARMPAEDPVAATLRY